MSTKAEIIGETGLIDPAVRGSHAKASLWSSYAILLVLILAFYGVLLTVTFFAVYNWAIAHGQQRQMANTANAVAKDLLETTGNCKLSEALKSLPQFTPTSSDKTIKHKNYQIRWKTGVTVGVVSAFVVAGALALWLGLRKSWGARNAPPMNHIGFAFGTGAAIIVIVQLVFIFGVVYNYQPGDSNVAKAELLQAFINSAS